MFCPKCGSILLPKSAGGKKVLACSCGYRSAGAEMKFCEKGKKPDEKLAGVADPEQEEHTLPTTEEECPKCRNKTAYWWEVQTRAGDEPATKFLKCTKCKHIWRDYS